MRPGRVFTSTLVLAAVSSAACGAGDDSGSSATTAAADDNGTATSTATAPAGRGESGTDVATVDTAVPAVEEPGGDERAGFPDVYYQLQLAEFVVSASAVVALEPHEVTNGLDDVIEVRPFTVAVDEVLWDGPHIEHQTDAYPVAGSDAATIEFALGDAVSLAVDALRDRHDQPLVVGLTSLSKDYPGAEGADFAIGFVAIANPDGSWSFPGLPPDARGEEVLAAFVSSLGTNDPVDALDRHQRLLAEYRIDDIAQGGVERPEDLVALDRALAAVFAEPEVRWEDVPPDQRSLNPRAIPDGVREQVVAIGLEFVIDDEDLSSADRVSESLVSIRAPLGVVHQFYPSVGSHTILALQQPSSPLEVWLVDRGDDSESERLVAEIGPFPAGQVGVVRLEGVDGVDADGLAVEVVEVRAPTDFELNVASNGGVNPDGSLSDPPDTSTDTG